MAGTTSFAMAPGASGICGNDATDASITAQVTDEAPMGSNDLVDTTLMVTSYLGASSA
jgi:hypothetical protein